MNRVKNFIGAMREKGVRTVKRAVPAFFTAYCYFSIRSRGKSRKKDCPFSCHAIRGFFL